MIIVLRKMSATENSILRTALIGFGKIAAGYCDDPQISSYYQYSTHVQVIKDHPNFTLSAVVDPSSNARRLAVKYLDSKNIFPDIDSMGSAVQNIDCIVICTLLAKI